MYVCEHILAYCLWRPEECTESPRTGDTDGCKPQGWYSNQMWILWQDNKGS